VIDFWLVGEGAQAPQRHAGAALDLKARLPGRGWRLVWGVAKIPTGIALRMPSDWVVRVTGRSSAFMRGIIVHDGLVESEFNGNELCALIYCPLPRVIRHGQRIAQMWALGLEREVFNQLTVAPNDLAPAKAGFGSTGRT
jgi:dUTPase